MSAMVRRFLQVLASRAAGSVGPSGSGRRAHLYSAGDRPRPVRRRPRRLLGATARGDDAPRGRPGRPSRGAQPLAVPDRPAQRRRLPRSQRDPLPRWPDGLRCRVGDRHWAATWLSMGASRVDGCDFVAGAVERLREQYPGATFLLGDIAGARHHPRRPRLSVRDHDERAPAHPRRRPVRRRGRQHRRSGRARRAPAARRAGAPAAGPGRPATARRGVAGAGRSTSTGGRSRRPGWRWSMSAPARSWRPTRSSAGSRTTASAPGAGRQSAVGRAAGRRWASATGRAPLGRRPVLMRSGQAPSGKLILFRRPTCLRPAAVARYASVDPTDIPAAPASGACMAVLIDRWPRRHRPPPHRAPSRARLRRQGDRRRDPQGDRLPSRRRHPLRGAVGGLPHVEDRPRVPPRRRGRPRERRAVPAPLRRHQRQRHAEPDPAVRWSTTPGCTSPRRARSTATTGRSSSSRRSRPTPCSSRPTCYGWSKLQAEHYLRHFSQSQGLKAASMRFFMCYGPGERPDPYRSAMTNFIDNVRHDRPITVHRGTSRSWCYIDDIVAGCRSLMEGWDGRRYEAYNLGRDDPRPMTEVAELICRLLGKPTELDHPRRPGAARHPGEERLVRQGPRAIGLRRARSTSRRACGGRSRGRRRRSPDPAVRPRGTGQCASSSRAPAGSSGAM